MYRGFIKDNQNLAGQSLGSPDLRILSMTINRDILSKATSDFEVVSVPDAAAEGNVFGVYDDYGKTVYIGVITSISGNVIQTDQIISLFDDNWLWSNPAAVTIEQTVAEIIQNDWATNIDSMLQNIFSQFTITAGTNSVQLSLPTQEENFVTNFMEFIFQLYEAYGVLLDIDIAYNDTTPTITVFKPSYQKIQLGNNTNAVRNFNITTETFETNKLVLYSKDGATYRGSWYGTTSGITTNSAAGNRLPKINTKYVFSDDPEDDIIGDNLQDEMYNHKINVELVLANKLYNFDDFKLGQEFDIFYNDTYYNSILTGYKITVDSEGKADIVTLVFGKVRYSLENKLYKLSVQNNSSSSSSGGGGGGGGGGSDFKFIKGTPIDLYDTDGETVLYSRNPENLVFYDGDSGDNASSNFIYCHCSNGSLTTSDTTITSWTANKQKGSGFEISGGQVKCNKNGYVRVFTAIDNYVNASTTRYVSISKNGTNQTTNEATFSSYGSISSAYVMSVVAGDLISVRVRSDNTTSSAYSGARSYLYCEYVEDYYITQAVSESNTYSTNEIEIGRWIDGKPIYRKVIVATTVAGANSINTGISNIDRMIKWEGSTKQANSNVGGLSYYISSTDFSVCYYAGGSNQFIIRTGSSYGFGQTVIICDYTKTTDG